MMSRKPAEEAQLQKQIGEALREPYYEAARDADALADQLAHELYLRGATFDPLGLEAVREAVRKTADLSATLQERVRRFAAHPAPQSRKHPGQIERATRASAPKRKKQKAQSPQIESTDVSPLAQVVSEKISGGMPWRISTRDLSRHTTKVLAKLHEDQRPAVITYRGVPSFLVLPIDQSDMFTLFWGNSPSLREDDEAAHAELAQGEDKVAFFS
jgi:hypothetical protein